MQIAQTEITTAATDGLLAVVCLCLVVWISTFRKPQPWKKRVWSWIFGLLALASILGAIAHGMYLSPGSRSVLWHVLYLALGIDVALFVLAGVCDWHGEETARRLFPISVLVGCVFFGVTVVIDGAFAVFIAYEVVGMAAALGIYGWLAVRSRMPGAGLLVVGIVLNMFAAVLQASKAEIMMVWPFDHNGIFHLVQIPALLVLGCGLRASFIRN